MTSEGHSKGMHCSAWMIALWRECDERCQGYKKADDSWRPTEIRQCWMWLFTSATYKKSTASNTPLGSTNTHAFRWCWLTWQQKANGWKVAVGGTGYQSRRRGVFVDGRPLWQPLFGQPLDQEKMAAIAHPSRYLLTVRGPNKDYREG